MSIINHNPVSAKELDNLLAQAFLNLDFNDAKNNELMETIATHHLMHSTSFLYKLKQFFSSNLLIGIVVLSVVILAFIFNDSTTKEAYAERTAITEPASAPNEVLSTANPVTPEKEVSNASTVNGNGNPVTETPGNDPQTSLSIPAVEEGDIETEPTVYQPQPVNTNLLKQKKERYIFPTLTEEEIKAHYKQKNKMIAALVKINKAKYAYIPSGSCDYKNQTVSVQAFYAQTTEVTNLEYRTFLSDLVLQDRKQEFLAAVPDQTQWTKRMPFAYDEAMTTAYFSHPAYDEYPVVNIPRKGAELYCQWLSEEVNAVLKENNKTVVLDMHLPDEYEWVYAASNQKTRLKYASGNTWLRNSKGCYEVNYVCHSIEECKYDTTLQVYLPVVDKWGYFEDGAFYTARVTSYLPNTYGLYCMAGNVSEMIVTHDSKKPATKGGSWFSCDHFLEIEAEDEHRGEINPSPFIGFRPVFTTAAVE